MIASFTNRDAPRTKSLYAFLKKRNLLIACAVLLLVITSLYTLKRDADRRYETLISSIIYDRNHLPLKVSENEKGHYVVPLNVLPSTFIPLLLAKEDRYFYYHPGINPLSTIRAMIGRLRGGSITGGSTITQQLAKNILGNESERSITNKLVESAYAVSMEAFLSKEDILTRYANLVFLGNQVQGFESGSFAYFGKALADTSLAEQLMLLATLSHPSTRNPWADDDGTYASRLSKDLGLIGTYIAPHIAREFSFQRPLSFELSSLGITCDGRCSVSLDGEMNEHIRAILQRHVEKEYHRGLRNGAVVVIDPKTERILAMVGSVDPRKTTDSGQINMALEPRPIGSTVKPFIYLKGFLEGLRPYTLVDDREYRYPIASGFALYPKNYDGTYRGIITLHEALSNSLNVPSVKVLEFIGLANFYRFLTETLAFEPIQPLDSYQYGIALGGLETDLLTLTYYFSLFPRGGTLAPLTLGGVESSKSLPPKAHLQGIVTIAPPEYVELVTAITSDRLTGVEQFGLKSNLNLPSKDYAVKTGTSRDFHDSWVVGYTPDLVVGVWVGNAENEAMDQVSGAAGAGAIWHDVMEYLFASGYEPSERILKRDLLQSFPIEGSEEWGLPGDDIGEHRDLLVSDALITSIHEGDIFEWKPNMVIPLRARSEVTWTINGAEHGQGAESSFTPKEAGGYEIMATDAKGKREIVRVEVRLAE